MKMNVILKTNPNSSRRTRNRIREHGPHFRAERSSGDCQGGPWAIGQLCWLVRAEDGWLGWLPRSEFDFTHADQFPKADPDFRDMMPTSEEFYADGRCEDAPCCGCCGDSVDDGYGTYADDAWHDAHEYPEW